METLAEMNTWRLQLMAIELFEHMEAIPDDLAKAQYEAVLRELENRDDLYEGESE